MPRWLLSLLLVLALGCQSFAALAKSHEAAVAPMVAGLHSLQGSGCEAPAHPLTTLEERSPATELAPDLSEICGLRNAALHHAAWRGAAPPQYVHTPASRVPRVPLKPPRTDIAV
ncbi:hypothetical protein ABL840_04200 [Variovorax sp. NFACC27]|uniref:hypothetical protein n=1 Tax=unclassified Variovorax TaxID=663243 RepID=UPI00089723C9|nr:hypothetical protein [Variovorax sp. YR750]SEF26282.1 hypothetical protein SAMN03159371_02502 [Variovorax sp. NFACC28]SEG54460.1 hypothetical protein SAMN03159365_02583 [Variovorax sp. NFACC29]SFC14201.1 hypothetical protein SAMN03159379_01527 [Variovorax sp. NFACC26]SFH09973.1 hypothetical protein SAMN03159447_06612 [Variovorax sp. NFACC27]SEL81947.1 hypothetical protein SAMN05518845_111257 [Variovorax sp. YR750]